MEKYGYRFTFGPWNIHEGTDPFGPPVRPELSFERKLLFYKELGFDAVQFHDDDAVPNLDGLPRLRSASKPGMYAASCATTGLAPNSSPPACGRAP